jgi:uncharacterized protein YbaP (TraB family)
MILGTSGVQFWNGVEPLINQCAQNDGRAIGYLEDVGEFAGLLDAIPAADYERSIRLTLNNPVAARAAIVANIYKAWLEGDAEVVLTAMQASAMNQFPTIRSAMLDARNALWLPRIIAMAGSPKRTLIFVGAGHLGGANGIAAMLTRAGYQLRPLLN